MKAVWTVKPLHFTYMGFTAHFSCDGLADQVRTILLELGARADLKVFSTGCAGGFGRPTAFPSVSADVAVLEPVGEQGAPADAKVIDAQWKPVTVAPRGPALDAAGKCELTEQVKTFILPLFPARNVAYSSTCVPHQLEVGGTQLAAEVLVPRPPAAASATPGGS